MRIVVFLKFICLLLWGVSPSMEAKLANTTSHYYAKQQFADNNWTTLSKKDQVTVVIEDNESDIEEEFHSGNTQKNKNENSLSSGKYNLLNSNTAIKFLVFNPLFDYPSSKNSSPIFGKTSPIYIKNRVLII